MGTQDQVAAGHLSLVGEEVRSGQRLCFEATVLGLPKTLRQMLEAPAKT